MYPYHDGQQRINSSLTVGSAVDIEGEAIVFMAHHLPEIKANLLAARLPSLFIASVGKNLVNGLYCGHSGPHFKASQVPCQGSLGCGGRNLRSPTGASAYGIPRKERKERPSEECRTTPRSNPVEVDKMVRSIGYRQERNGFRRSCCWRRRSYGGGRPTLYYYTAAADQGGERRRRLDKDFPI